MKTFAIPLGFVLLCPSVAFADQNQDDVNLWLGTWCTGWSSGDSPQVGYPIVLTLESVAGSITGSDVHNEIKTTYENIKVTRDAKNKIQMEGTWRQDGEIKYAGVFNMTLSDDEESFEGRWKDNSPRTGKGEYRGKKLKLGTKCS